MSSFRTHRLVKYEQEYESFVNHTRALVERGPHHFFYIDKCFILSQT